MRTPKAPKPDKQIGEAAKENAAVSREMAEISRDTLDFTKEQYADQMAEYQRLVPIFEQLAAGQIASVDIANQITQQARDDYNEIYRPVERQVVQDAMRAGSAAEQERRAGEAGIDFQRQMDMQRDISERNLRSMGVNPNSGAFASANRTTQILAAAGRAGAQTQARERERLRGDAMRQGAAAMGKGMTGTALTGITVGGNAAAQAAGLAGTGLNTMGNIGQNYLAGRAGAQGMMGNAANVNAGAANILNNLYASQMQGYGMQAGGAASMFGALGNIGGAALGAWLSDEDKKTGKKPASGKKARKAIDKMPVDRWRYKEGESFDEAEHIGPYAQDFAKETGVGDGRTINVIDAIGVNMAATKELSKEVRDLKREVKGARA